MNAACTPERSLNENILGQAKRFAITARCFMFPNENILASLR